VNDWDGVGIGDKCVIVKCVKKGYFWVFFGYDFCMHIFFSKRLHVLLFIYIR